jgi:hypothetical protein
MMAEDDAGVPVLARRAGLPGGWDDSRNYEVAAALSMGPMSAQHLAGLAWTLGTRLPGIGRLLADGTLTRSKARLVATVFESLDEGEAARAEALVLGELAGKTYPQAERLAWRAALAVAPDVAERRRSRAERQARVTVFREEAGTAGLSGRDLPAAEALAGHANVVARAAVYEASGAFGGQAASRLQAQAYLDLLNGVPAQDRIAFAAADRPEPPDDPGQSPGDSPGGPVPSDGDDGPDPGGGDGDGPESGPCPGRSDADGQDRGDGVSPAHGDDGFGNDTGHGGGISDLDDTGSHDDEDDDDDDFDFDGGHSDDRDSADSDSGADDFNGSDGDDGGSSGPGGPGAPQAAAPRPPLAEVTVPLATLQHQAERAGDSRLLGPLDPALARHLAAAAARSPHSHWEITVTDARGYATGHGTARPAPRRPGQPPPPGPSQSPALTVLPARVNITITETYLRQLAQDTQPRSGAPPGDWQLRPEKTGTWTLTLPGSRQLTVRFDVVPTHDCDHRYQTSAYQPGEKLRRLVQVRDHQCTFPTCSRAARESDFEHAIPYDKGGKTDACNAGARSRRCHRVKQSPGWTLTQPQPGWHQWTTPTGRTYTQEPWRYTA